MLYIESIAL